MRSFGREWQPTQGREKLGPQTSINDLAMMYATYRMQEWYNDTDHEVEAMTKLASTWAILRWRRMTMKIEHVMDIMETGWASSKGASHKFAVMKTMYCLVNFSITHPPKRGVWRENDNCRDMRAFSNNSHVQYSPWTMRYYRYDRRPYDVAWHLAT